MSRPSVPSQRSLLASLVLMLGWVLLLQACGGGGGGGGGAPSPRSYQMGGAIQGVALNLSGAVTTQAGTPGGVDGTGAAATFSVPSGAVTVGGDLYVADSSNHTIRRIVIATGVVTTLAGTAGAFGSADGTGADARFGSPQGITTDGTNLYVADSNNSTIRRIMIATGVVTTLAGSNFGSADGTGATAQFNYPLGITTDGTNLYVADNRNHTIRQIVIATGIVTTLAGTAGSIGSADGTGSAARFYYPQGITTDGTSLYVADNFSHTIRRIVIATGVVTTLAGTAGSIGSADGTGTAARFNYPQGIATDGNNLYVADSGNRTLRRIVIATGVVTTLAGTPSGVDGTGTAARFNYPLGITTDGTNLYVADNRNHTIRRIVIATGVVTTLAGTAGVFGSADGTGADARFGSPQGITTDGTNLYVADGNDTIRRIVIATGVVTTLAGTAGTSGSADGTGAEAQFNSPQGITTDGSSLYVADTGNHTIRRIVIATGVVTTLAGTGRGSADGTGAAALFYSPQGITTNGTSLYVSDTRNNTIRRIVIATGVVTTLAGTAGLSGGPTDGTGADARFDTPQGITTDGTNLYVADSENYTIRRIVIATGVVTTLAGTAGSIGSADGTGTAARFNYPRGITTDGQRVLIADTNNHTVRMMQ